MKRYATLAMLAVIGTASLSATAATHGVVGPPGEELGEVADLSRLSLGLSYQCAKREVQLNRGEFEILEVHLGALQVGVDVFDWLTIYGTIGQAERRDGEEPWLDDWDMFHGYGAKARFLAHEVDGPPIVAGTTSIEAGINYTKFEIGQDTGERVWHELLCHAVLRHELYADYPDGEEPHHYPHSLVFHVGPVFSELSADYHARQKWGVLAGVTIYATKNIAFSYEIQAYEKLTQSLNLGFHF